MADYRWGYRHREPLTMEELHRPRPYESWHEDFGCVLWYRMPIEEPPYVGTPDSSDWPFDEEDESRLFWAPLPDGNVINDNWDALKAEADCGAEVRS